MRRRRQCAGCGNRFTTYERHEVRALFVRKRDGRVQPFDREKISGGLKRASHKRPVEPETIEALVEQIEAEAIRGGGEINAARVGELCLAGLKEIDQVAYLQFAAVYRQLGVEEVQAELELLAPEPTGS